jgi:rubrerythrin
MADHNSVTVQNLEAAFAGESMAHIKYRYFAKLARAAGAEDVAKAFEATAEQEVMHAFGHLDLLYPKAKMTPAKALEIAIEGETYEYTEMYPKFRHLALEEGNQAAVAEFDEQIAESKEVPPHLGNGCQALRRARQGRGTPCQPLSRRAQRAGQGRLSLHRIQSRRGNP